MKNYTLIIVSLFTVLTLKSHAQNENFRSNCGILSTNVLYLKQNEFSLIFDDSKENVNHHLAKLSPGIHKIRAYVTGQGVRGNSNMTVNIGINRLDTTARVLDFYINIEANKKYVLVAEEVPNEEELSANKFRVKIKAKTDRECELSEQESKEKSIEYLNDVEHSEQDLPEIPAQQQVKVTLPESLAYRLGRLTKEISQYMASKNIKNENITISQPNRVMNQLGIAIDIEDDVNKGLKVLAVTPYSIAESIGLQPDDVIIAINDTSYFDGKSDKRQLLQKVKEMIADLTSSRYLTISVMRNGEVEDLSVEYTKISSPSYKLEIQQY